MPSTQRVREYDELIGAGIAVLIILGVVSGIVLSNWAIFELLLPAVVSILVILLFYRLVVAVEHLAYDS